MTSSSFWSTVSVLVGAGLAFAAAHTALIPPPYNLYATAGVALLTGVYHLFRPTPAVTVTGAP